MRCIQLDFTSDSFQGYEYAYRIRTGYLLSNMLNIVGYCTHLITISPFIKQLPVAKRAKFMYDTKLCEDEDVQGILENFLDQQKEFKSMKHPPNNIFLLSKKLENALANVVSEWLVGFDKNLTKHGLTGLLDLCVNDSFEISDLETTTGIESENSYLTIKLLNNKSDEENINNSVWLMPELFYHENYFETLVATNIDEIEEDMPYLIKCFDMPNLNILSVKEMESLKKMFNLVLASFKEETQEWANRCYQSNGKKHFIDHVFPTMPSIKETIDASEIINHLKNIPAGQLSASICMGEISPLILWKYYYLNKLLSEEDYNELVGEYDSLPNYTIPIMVFFSPGNELKLLKNEETESLEVVEPTEVTTVRKYINID